jgi:type II secretory pathway pseudopilin PulG
MVRLMRQHRSQQGSTLLVLLVLVVILGLLFGSVLGFATTNNNSVRAYRSLRAFRYAGDGAIKAAVNWAKDQPTVGRDPSLNPGDPACIRHVATDLGNLTVDCAAKPGGGSGKPAEPGLVPPEALLLLGTRQNQPGPYNVPDCKGWWETTTGWFKSGVDPDATGPYEASGRFERRRGLGFANATCDTERTRTRTNFAVQGDLVAAGRIEVADAGTVSVSGQTRARAGCNGGGLVCTTPVNRADGTPQDTDPARPVTPGVNPMDIKPAWESVAFQQDGSLRPGAYLPDRNTAYVWNPGTISTDPNIPHGLVASASCAGTGATMVFLPGRYQSSQSLNQYTTASGCSGVTFWFAPDPGPDRLLLTDDDHTGAFYFDLRSGAAIGCNQMAAKVSRWCIGGSNSSNIRIVTGTPKDWSPLGSASLSPPDVGDTRPRLAVTVDSASTVDSDLSVSWFTPEGAKKIGDGNVAKYRPCSVWIFTCTSFNRSIRVRDLQTKVTGPPIDTVGAPKGKIFVDVAYSLENATYLDIPTLSIAAVTQDSGERDCGAYTLAKGGGFSGVTPSTYTFSDAQAKQLADTCGSADLINGYELTMKTTGDYLNGGFSGQIPQVWLDGVRIRYDSAQGAKFPIAQSGSNQAAWRDCDPKKPGGQLIFGGESHVYVADGSLEVCAGPFPTAPEVHQSTGIFALPEVASLRPSSVTDGGFGPSEAGNGNGFQSGANAALIDDRTNVEATNTAKLSYSCNPPWYQIGICGQTLERRANITMTPYSAPNGYRIKRIDARVSYNPKNQGCSFLWSCPGASPQLRLPRCTLDLPKNPDRGSLQVGNTELLRLYDYNVKDCYSPTDLLNSQQFVYAARANGGAAWPTYNDSLDGVELQITLEPTGSAAMLIPQSGCVVAYPNYNGGQGNPDCALLRAETADFADNWTLPWQGSEGKWTGRFGVQGSVYAPSSAVEIDDTDYAYTLATRGAILRHLRVSGWGARPGFSGPAFGGNVDKTPVAREATFTACTQSALRLAANLACNAGQGDKIITRSGVRFEPDASGLARVPNHVWWSTDQ